MADFRAHSQNHRKGVFEVPFIKRRDKLYFYVYHKIFGGII